MAHLFHLLRVFGRYRLDEFLKGHEGTLLLRYMLSPFTLGNHQSLKEPIAVRLRKSLEELGPIYVKFGQLLSTRRDFLPNDIADELQSLQDLEQRPIQVAGHCLGCTAGAGSSCGGALV